jgi:hypothetical protein
MPVRKVSNRGRNVIGRFPSIKMGRMIAFESLLERDFIYLIDYELSVGWFEEQPLTIAYQHEGKVLHYTPDFHLVECQRHVVVECKPECFVESAENQRKFAAAQEWCEGLGWEFRIITDRQVCSGFRLQNIKFLTRYARLKMDPVLCSQIQAFLQETQATPSIQELAEAIFSINPRAATAGILHLAYHHEIDLPIDTAPISGKTLVSPPNPIQERQP